MPTQFYREMEQQLNLEPRQLNLEPSPDTTLLMLNNHCLHEIFEQLEFDDFMSLAETCCRLKTVSEWSFEKYQDFEFNFVIAKEGRDYIDRIWFHIGKKLRSLTIYSCYPLRGNAEYVLRKAKEISINLIGLEIHWLDFVGNMPSLCGFDNLVWLTLNECDIRCNDDFFGTMGNLKFLNILDCLLNENAFIKCLKNNPNIISLTFDGLNSIYPQLLPNLEMISLAGPLDHFNLNPLSQLNRLTKLKLDNWQFCNEVSINDGLVKLLENLNLRELELVRLTIDGRTFDALKSCDNLRLLVIESLRFGGLKWNSSFRLPRNLEDLKLINFEISSNGIVSIVQQVQNLGNFVLRHCKTEISNARMLEALSNVIDCNDYNPILNVVFISRYLYQSEQVTCGRLTIFRSREHPKNIFDPRITFLGCVGE
jgi:hypothetical protein